MPHNWPISPLPQLFGGARSARCLARVILALLAMAMPALAIPKPSNATPPLTRLDPPASVSFGVWVGALTELLDTVPAPAIEGEYAQFITSHALPAHDPQLYEDFRRVRLLFEALRDGGFWHLRWAVTDQYPSSKLIWQAWSRNPVHPDFAEPSATAECDELSALFGMLARHVGVHNVGLFYPTWNHTIAVWAPLEGKRKTALVQLPTTQIFLDCAGGFDKTSFHTSLKNIERYPNGDVRADAAIPHARAEWLLHQIRAYAGASPALWSLMRAKRAFAMGSSMGPCSEARSTWYALLEPQMTQGDLDALRTLSLEEFDQQKPAPARLLSWLKE